MHKIVMIFESEKDRASVVNYLNKRDERAGYSDAVGLWSGQIGERSPWCPESPAEAEGKAIRARAEERAREAREERAQAILESDARMVWRSGEPYYQVMVENHHLGHFDPAGLKAKIVETLEKLEA